MKILILASQHGNEYSGEKLYRYIQRNRPELLEHVRFMMGNPKARKQRVRYTESDMNRSYDGRTDTYEHRRAQKVLKHIKDTGYDLVLDMHTTTVEQPACLIVASVNERNRAFLQASSINKIVVIANSIADSALNGVLPEAVSIEINQDVQPETLEELCDDVARFIAKETLNTPRFAYEAKELLSKTELNDEQLANLSNFELSEFGFYPILVGENSYKKHTKYIGFKAHKRYEFKV